METQGDNIYVSMTRDGYYALELLLQRGKKIDSVISYPKNLANKISDYVDFKSLVRKHSLKLLYTKGIGFLKNRFRKNIPNVIIVNGWSQLLRKDVLDIPENGCVGTHPALLPKNRGRSPIPWHFINQERYGGVSVFYLDAEVDAGPVIDQERFEIKKTDNASSYYEKITKIGARLLLKNFDDIVSGQAKAHARMQDHSKATYLLRRRPKDSYLSFEKKDSKEIHNLVRAVSDIYPSPFFYFGGKKFLSNRSSVFSQSRKYSGIPGQIAYIKLNQIGILCKTGIIELRNILDTSLKPINVMKVFKIGDVLNE